MGWPFFGGAALCGTHAIWLEWAVCPLKGNFFAIIDFVDS